MRQAHFKFISTLPVATFFLTGCSGGEVSGLGFEEGVSSVSEQSLSLWQGAWITAAVVGIFTLILILWPVFFHRKKDENFPKQTQYNIPVEVAYTVIPFIIVAVLFYFTAQRESRILKISPDKQVSHFIDVNGFQWSWQFKYKDAGDYKSATVTGSPAQPPTLYLPLGENVRFTLSASDVVHGFWIPAFMIQMQNLPGVTNQLEFSATKLGTFPGRCNILCGRNHSQMLFNVKVVTPAEYEIYIQSLVAEEKAVIS
jgi:cytochrome c oxidase subunit 2